ncbi:MAG: 4-hydroxy-3-methylbut-2-enyl diphosphate reductase [Bacilli bacterium]|nr:4-hydroxy-3-methylbut-2-enyl diphosphate reductase [Bacilli bacterium]
MKIEVLTPSGYCAGVASAMEIAKKARLANPNDKIVVLGMLVHNNDALKELESLSIDTIYKPGVSLIDLIDEIEEDNIVILTAHGHSKAVEEKLNKRGIRFIDATCPFVKNSFKEISGEIKKGHQVIYISKKNHPESNAALSLGKDVVLVELNKELDLSKIKDPNPMIISQTTFSKYDVEKIVNKIKGKIPNARVNNGICHASSDRQEALLNGDVSADLVYVVGGVNSNNTKTLFKMAKDHYVNSKVIAIENELDIKEKDLIGLSHVIISSGASTPISVINRIVKKIELLCN